MNHKAHYSVEIRPLESLSSTHLSPPNLKRRDYLEKLDGYGLRSVFDVINRSLEKGDSRLRFSFMYNRLGDWITNEAPGSTHGEELGGYQDFAFRIQLARPIAQNTDALLNTHGRQLTNATSTMF